MNPIKAKLIVLACVCFLLSSSHSFAQNLEGTVKVTIVEEINGSINTSIFTFPDKKAADQKLKELGFSECNFKAISKTTPEEGKVTVSMESSGLTDIDTGEIRLDKLISLPENAVIKDLPNGGKQVTWIDIDNQGNIHTRMATFNKGSGR